MSVEWSIESGRVRSGRVMVGSVGRIMIENPLGTRLFSPSHDLP